MDLREFLGLGPQASPAEVDEVYNRKRAEILASAGGEAELHDLEGAYTRWKSESSTALVQAAPAVSGPDATGTSILHMVDKFDAPIRDYSDHAVYQPCPYCGQNNAEQAQVCSSCGKQIRRPCPNCGSVNFIGLQVCPRCNTVIQELDRQRLADGMFQQDRLARERQANEIRESALERGHRIRAMMGMVFWLVVILAAMALCIFGIYAFTRFQIGT